MASDGIHRRGRVYGDGRGRRGGCAPVVHYVQAVVARVRRIGRIDGWILISGSKAAWPRPVVGARYRI